VNAHRNRNGGDRNKEVVLYVAVALLLTLIGLWIWLNI